MIKNKFNSRLREYARTLSPKSSERDLVGKLYQSFNDLFGANNCIQIGSYPRFTAIAPISDLDILYILGPWDENNHTPSTTLQNLFNQISSDYNNPTNFTKKVSLQTHSVTIEFWQNSNMIISIDIVPAYSYSLNKYGQDKYKVPEVIKEKNHSKRNSLTWDALSLHAWINSDPRGYLKIATEVGVNHDFRKTVKLIKKWKNDLSDQDEDLKLKSFHLEQAIVNIFQLDPDIEIFNAIFLFFINLPSIISMPNQIPDIANNDKYIDDYLKKLTPAQKKKIIYARDNFLIKLENLKESDPVDNLMTIIFYERFSSEKYLFDKKIPVLTDSSYNFKIDGFVKPLSGFSSGWLSSTPQLQSGLTCGSGRKRHINFSVKINNTNADRHEWKVRNDNNCGYPRGEITLNQTKNDPESTEYPGSHFVECFAIQDNICMAKSRINVKVV